VDGERLGRLVDGDDGEHRGGEQAAGGVGGADQARAARATRPFRKVLPRTVEHPGIRLDTGGMVLIGAALIAIIYPLIQGRTPGWPTWTFVTLAAGALLLGAFVMWERRQHGDPLIEPGLLANRTYTTGILVALAFFGAFGGLVLCLSLFTQAPRMLRRRQIVCTSRPYCGGIKKRRARTAVVFC
jgi:hypothetical protein